MGWTRCGRDGELASVDAPTQFQSRQLHASDDGRLRMVTPASPGYSFVWQTDSRRNTCLSLYANSPR